MAQLTAFLKKLLTRTPFCCMFGLVRVLPPELRGPFATVGFFSGPTPQTLFSPFGDGGRSHSTALTGCGVVKKNANFQNRNYGKGATFQFFWLPAFEDVQKMKIFAQWIFVQTSSRPKQDRSFLSRGDFQVMEMSLFSFSTNVLGSTCTNHWAAPRFQTFLHLSNQFLPTISPTFGLGAISLSFLLLFLKTNCPFYLKTNCKRVCHYLCFFPPPPSPTFVPGCEHSRPIVQKEVSVILRASFPISSLFFSEEWLRRLRLSCVPSFITPLPMPPVWGGQPGPCQPFVPVVGVFPCTRRSVL